jgi:hypothetical protein
LPSRVLLRVLSESKAKKSAYWPEVNSLRRSKDGFARVTLDQQVIHEGHEATRMKINGRGELRQQFIWFRANHFRPAAPAQEAPTSESVDICQRRG